MTTQFIVNEKGERTSVIIPIDEYEDLLNMVNVVGEPTQEYKVIMDQTLHKIESGEATYLSLDDIKKRFPRR